MLASDSCCGLEEEASTGIAEFFQRCHFPVVLRQHYLSLIEPKRVIPCHDFVARSLRT